MKQTIFCTRDYILIDPTDRSHPIQLYHTLHTRRAVMDDYYTPHILTPTSIHTRYYAVKYIRLSHTLHTRRAVMDDSNTVSSLLDGTVVGWLPAHLSNYFTHNSSAPSALWRVKYDDGAIRGNAWLERQVHILKIQLCQIIMWNTHEFI